MRNPYGMLVQSYQGTWERRMPLVYHGESSHGQHVGDLNIEPIFRNLLYDNSKHSDQVNTKLFEILHNCIVETGCF